MKYLILGGGLQGRALAFDLLTYDPGCEVVVGDNNEENLELTRKLIKIGGLSTVKVDVFDEEATARVMEGIDVAISSLPHTWPFTEKFYQAVVKAGVKGVLTDYWEWQRHYEFDELLKKAKTAVIPGLGIVPGFGNICVGQAAHEFDQLEEGAIYCGGLPVRKNLPPLDYMEMFIMESLFDLYYTDPQIIMDGEVVTLKCAEDIEKFYLPGVGETEAIFTDGLYSLLKTMKERGVRKLTEKTLRYPGHFEKVEILRSIGFLDREPLKVGEIEVSPRQFTETLFSKKLKKIPGERDFTYLLVRVKGMKDGKRVEKKWEIMDYSDEVNGLTSMERTTAYPSSIAAIILAHDKSDLYGILEPELYFIGDKFKKMVDELALRGIFVYESLL